MLTCTRSVLQTLYSENSDQGSEKLFNNLLKLLLVASLLKLSFGEGSLLLDGIES